MAVIFAASSLPGSDVPGHFSVYAHFAEYAILGLLLFLALRATLDTRTAALVALAVASFYGATDEVHQVFTPGRVPDPLDWVTDTAGAAFGILVALAVLARRRGEGARAQTASDRRR
jgi:VanZ family protein